MEGNEIVYWEYYVYDIEDLITELKRLKEVHGGKVTFHVVDDYGSSEIVLTVTK